jgi:hypothetical protein
MKRIISNIYKVLFSTRFLGTLVILYLIAFIISTINRSINIDDAWLGEYAYWQAKLGYVKSELMRGITMEEIRLICHHKFLTLQGALFINLFGFSLYSLKVISLIYFIIFLLAFYFFTFKKIFSPGWLYLTLLLIISNALIFDFAFVFRPEIPIMTLGFLVYILLDHVLKSNKNSIILTVSGGLLAGLCVSTHLNGIVFIIAGFLLLIFNKKYLLSFIFAFSTLPTIAIYFYDFTSQYNIEFWMYQIQQSPSIDKASNLPVGLSQLYNLMNEHLRYFHSPIEITFSLLFIITCILAFKHLKTQRNLVLYTLVLMISLGLIAIHKTPKYSIIYLPYLVILMVSSFRFLFEKHRSENTKNSGNNLYLISLLIIVYLLTNTIYNIKTSIVKFHVSENRQLITKYILEKTDSCRIVAPMSIIFNEINNFKSIQSDLCYSEMQKSNKLIYKQGFLDLTKKYEADYIILSEMDIKKFGLNDFAGSDFNSNGFDLIVKTDKLMILKNTERYNCRIKNSQLN